MSKTSTKDKRKYNKETYRRYEISVRADTKLNRALETYRENMDDSVSNLIKTLLCTHFGLDIDELFVEHYIALIEGKTIYTPNTCMDEIFTRLKNSQNNLYVK